MTSSTRLKLSGGLIVLSAIYAIILAQDPEVASALTLWYIALLLTVFVLANVWKKP